MRRRTCAVCGESLPPPKETGRPREYCGAACRQKARYHRRGDRVDWWRARAQIAEFDQVDVELEELTQRLQLAEQLRERQQ